MLWVGHRPLGFRVTPRARPSVVAGRPDLGSGGRRERHLGTPGTERVPRPAGAYLPSPTPPRVSFFAASGWTRDAFSFWEAAMAKGIVCSPMGKAKKGMTTKGGKATYGGKMTGKR